MQTGDGKYTFIHAMRLTVLGSKDNRLYVDLDLDQGNFLCLIDWKFLLPLSFKRFIGLKNYGLISSFFTKIERKSAHLYGLPEYRQFREDSFSTNEFIS